MNLPALFGNPMRHPLVLGLAILYLVGVLALPGVARVVFILAGAVVLLLISNVRAGSLNRVLAVAELTWKAAFRFRLFWVMLGLLLASVFVLPLLLKHDGTARGLAQIMLTYTLSLITALLGLSTLWLACGTLARDIEECQLQVVAVKPISRWEIWLGKWLGLLLLNACLLAIAGGSVYFLLLWRAQGLSPAEQQVLHKEIFVARASLKEPAPDLEQRVEAEFQRRLQQVPVPPEQQPALRAELLQQFKAGVQVVPPNYLRLRSVDFGYRKHLVQDQPLYLRVKFHVAQTNASGTYLGRWYIGPTNDPQRMVSLELKLADNAFHEIEIPPNLLDAAGKLNVLFQNAEPVVLLFPLEDGFEVLYREGGFELNFLRGLLIILCWLALLAALGLAAASLLSFPVAAFISASVLMIALSSGTLASVVDEGSLLGPNPETGVRAALGRTDALFIPLFKAILWVLNLVQAFSPVDALSTGRSISWWLLAKAFLHIVVLLGGVLAALGITCFNRRELATAQSNV